MFQGVLNNMKQSVFSIDKDGKVIIESNFPEYPISHLKVIGGRLFRFAKLAIWWGFAGAYLGKEDS